MQSLSLISNIIYVLQIFFKLPFLAMSIYWYTVDLVHFLWYQCKWHSKGEHSIHYNKKKIGMLCAPFQYIIYVVHLYYIRRGHFMVHCQNVCGANLFSCFWKITMNSRCSISLIIDVPRLAVYIFFAELCVPGHGWVAGIFTL